MIFGVNKLAEFGELLVELRRDRHMTQAELAKILFVSAGTISNYEKGVHLPDVEKLMAIADYFHVSTDYLLGRTVHDCSLDILDSPVGSGMTLGGLVKDITSLEPERVRSLLLIVNDMKLSATIKKYGGKE